MTTILGHILSIKVNFSPPFSYKNPERYSLRFYSNSKMGFTSNEKPYYDLGNNGYLPENTDFHKDIIANWKQYIQEHPGELVYIPTAFTATTRINRLLRAHEFDKDDNHLDSELILPNFFDPVALRNNLDTGSSIVDFVLQHNITGGKNFTTKDTEFAKPIDTKIGFVNDMMKNYLDSSSQPLHNLNGKIPRAQIWRYYLRTVDDHFAQFPMMQELIIIGLIHSGDLNEPHLSPHMLKYCKLNLTNRDRYPHGFKHAQMAAFSHTHGHTGHNKPLIWTLDDHHINGIETVCEKLDLHLYSFLQSTLPKFLLDHAANNSEIERSGVNLISYINKSFGKLSYADGAEIKHQLDKWNKLSITTAPLKSLNAFHEKYLLYQDIQKPKNGNISMKDREQTIKHAIISLLGDDYGDERTVSLSEQVQHDESLTVVSLISKIVELQSLYHRRNQAKTSHGKRKIDNHQSDSKRQNTSHRNGQSFDRPICNVCGKHHLGTCRNQQALQRYNATKNTSFNRNTSSPPVCGLCRKTGHTTANCHRDPKNAAAAEKWRAQMQQKNIRNGNDKPNINGYTPKNNTNKVNNIELNEHDGKDDNVTKTDVVQHITHNDPDDDLVDFDSE